jgi:hypothetical protein
MLVDDECFQSPLLQAIAYQMHRSGLATLIFNLLTVEEQELEAEALYDDLGLLARRSIGALDWIRQHGLFRNKPLGFFGSRAGAAAVLIAAAERPDTTNAVVTCGGKSELSYMALSRIQAPVLFIAGENDLTGRRVCQQAAGWMRNGALKEVCVIPRAVDLFGERIAHESVMQAATRWFKNHLVETNKG